MPYFDHNATTPVAPEVLETAALALRDVYGNPSSIHHQGQAAKHSLEQARRNVASLLSAAARDIVFVSGGTEADNLALFGAVRYGNVRHVITSSIEHPAVLNTCTRLERDGVSISYVRAGRDGIVDPDDVRRMLRPDTGLVSVMHANNELGTIQPVEEIAAIAHEAGALFHSDGVQACGRIPVDVTAIGADLSSVSGHTMHAPKGTGALYAAKHVPLDPLLYGGRHENQRRAGTENVAGAAALGRAAILAAQPNDHVRRLRDRLETGILNRVSGVSVNGAGSRLPNTANLCFEGIEGEPMVIALDLKGFAVSSGAACSSGAVEPSHVLLAIGLSREEARSSIRFSLGRYNTEEEVDALIEAVAETAAHLRRLSPTHSAHV